MQTTLHRRLANRPGNRLGNRLGRRVAVAALVLATPALSACGGIGFNAQTEKVYQPAVGVNVRSSEVDVLGAVVVSAEPGSGVFIASLVNKNQDTADKLTSTQGSGVQVATGVTPKIPAGDLVNFADKSVGGIPVSGAKVKAGGYVTLRLSFQNADPVTVQVPVVTDTGPYAGLVGPTASASSTPAG